MAYNGSVEVVSGLKQKNNADFPIVEASAVYVADGKNLADIISGIEEINIKEYLDNNNQSQQSVMDSYGTRISTIENTVGTISGDKTIAQKLTEIDNEIGLNTSADNSLKNRVTSLETVVGSGIVTDRINSAVESEKTRATGEETSIKSRVSSLETAVGNGGSVDSRIAAETTRATNKENELNTAIQTEKTRATAKENEINTSISNEITRATAKENTLNTAIEAEKTRATGEETAVKNRVTSLENTVGTMSGDKTIAQKLTEIDNEIGLNTSADNSLKNRVTSLETVVGNTSEELTTETVAAIVEETARSIEAEDTLSYRIDYLEGLPVVMSVSNDTKYATHLNTITDSTGNVLAYFDTEGNFHVNGNIYSENW